MKIHVLSQSGLNTYTVAVHANTPPGNNSAGVSWADALKNSGRAVTVMMEGNGAGQIATAEKINVENGTVMEGVFQWGDDPSWNNAQRIADLDLRANQLIAELQARYQQELKFFGFTRNGA